MRDVWIALIAVGVGAVLAVLAEEVARWLTKQRRRRVLALLVCPVLDRFIADCQAVLDDEGDWTGGTRHFSVPMPTGPEFPAQVDWTSINPKLANRILSLPLATIRADQELGYLGDYVTPPEHEEAFVFRRKRCFKLQHDALRMSASSRMLPEGAERSSVEVVVEVLASEGDVEAALAGLFGPLVAQGVVVASLCGVGGSFQRLHGSVVDQCPK